ncbi:NtaA/DmoA family FMN-dependent monooxygenase [Streptomyces sp. NPDC055709]
MTTRQSGGGRPPKKQVRLAARLPGVDGTTLRSGPRSRGPIDFRSFERFARTAERGLFDFLLLAEGPEGPEGPGERRGRTDDLDAVGRPEPITVLNALAAVTDRLGLAATVDATFNEPYELARRLASLDHLSAGRAAWHVVTASDTSDPLDASDTFDVPGAENVRRGGFPDHADRYSRAAEFVRTARALWDSWAPDATPRRFEHRGRHFTIEGEFTVPRCPQGRPVVIQAGDSDEGREFAAAVADVVFTWHGTPEASRLFYADVKARLAAHGRAPDELTIMPGITFVLGDTDAEARERAAALRGQQISPRTAIRALERVWGRDLSAYDPDGPLPGIDPAPERVLVQGQGQGQGRGQGRGRVRDPLAVAAEWRALSEAKGLSIRETVIETTGRQTLAGTPSGIAAALDAWVQTDAADGFVLVPHPDPGGLDDFVDQVVPLLQERGAFRTAYAGATLRSHLGLPEPVGQSGKVDP